MVVHFGWMVWISCGNLLVGVFFLINRCHTYRWVVVSSLNYLILAIDLWSSFSQHLVKHAVDLPFGFICLTSHPLCCTPWFLLLYVCVACIILSFLLFSDKPGQDIWVIIETACLNIMKFDLSMFNEVLLSQSCMFLVLCLLGFDDGNFPSWEKKSPPPFFPLKF